MTTQNFQYAYQQGIVNSIDYAEALPTKGILDDTQVSSYISWHASLINQTLSDLNEPSSY